MNSLVVTVKAGGTRQCLVPKDVKIPTENGIYASGQITPMMNKEGNQLLYFTDFTSSEKDQDSALGYSLINARTGQVTYYRDTKVGIMDSDGAISIASKFIQKRNGKLVCQSFITLMACQRGLFR